MKNLLILLVVFASCTKQASKPEDVSQNKPTVTKVSFWPAYAGSNESVGFSVTINIPVDGSVKQLNLIRHSDEFAGAINNPKSGTYTTYDHVIGDYPFGQGMPYHFEFLMTDGSKIETAEILVY